MEHFTETIINEIKDDKLCQYMTMIDQQIEKRRKDHRRCLNKKSPSTKNMTYVNPKTSYKKIEN